MQLDPSARANGPLRVLPDSHCWGRLSAERIAELTQQITRVECLAGAGAVVAMRPLLLHASSKSTSDLPRRVLHLEYAAGAVLAPGIELVVG